MLMMVMQCSVMTSHVHTMLLPRLDWRRCGVLKMRKRKRLARLRKHLQHTLRRRRDHISLLLLLLHGLTVFLHRHQFRIV
jgi:hypothetical protein